MKIFVNDFGDDEYFHEMDHCATSDLSTMPDYDAEDAWEMESIAKRNKEGYEFYSGIQINGQYPSGPNYNTGIHENEGITVLKQSDYAKLKGISQPEIGDYKIEEQGGYIVNYHMAEQMAYIIGRDNLIQKHFYNDIDGIRKDFSRFGIDYDKMLELSSEFMVSNQHLSDPFSIMRRTIDDINEKKQIYQDMMAKGFVAKRCEELGISDINQYYTGLSRSQKKVEQAELTKFEQFKIYDSPQLDRIGEGLKPRGFLQSIKDFFTGKNTKMLPERTEGSRDYQFAEKDTEETKPWDLSNWGIDVEQFREESYQIAQDSLASRENGIENETQIEGRGPWDMAGPEI